MRYKITVSYDGSKFYGFQRLNDLPTIQKSIEEALKVIHKGPVEIKGAGRTDRGVHAYGQCCHFDLSLDIPKDHLMMAINSLLNEYVRVIDIEEVPTSFHARHSVKTKTYLYKINLGKYDPLQVDYALQLNHHVNIKEMKKAAKLFLGVHDFENFVAGKRKDYTAIVYDIKIYQKKDMLYLEFTGKSFYRYMVRNLVGALLEVGENKLTIEELKKYVDKEVIKSLPTVSPCGLYLISIKY